MTFSPREIRVLLGILLILAVAGLLLVDALVLRTHVLGSLTVVVLGLAGYWEFARMVGLLGAPGNDHAVDTAGSRSAVLGRLMGVLGFLGCAYLLGLAWWRGSAGNGGEEWVAGGAVVFFVVAFGLLGFREDYRAGFPRLLEALLGMLLFGFLFSYLLRIYQEGSREVAIWRSAVYLLGIKGTDISAYLVGSTIGRHHFLKISPKKTLEGSLAGVLFGALWFTGAGLIREEFFFGWPQCILFGIILALASQLGDQTGSVIKRFYGVKHSGGLLPEFGGVLDLIDSFLFSAFVFWWLVSFTH